LETAAAVLTVLGKPDCHLCHVMADVARQAVAGLHATVVERDVRDDPELHQRYRNDIPVLLLGDAEVVRHHVTEADLRSRLLAHGVLPR
jgi:hypothetical protein